MITPLVRLRKLKFDLAQELIPLYDSREAESISSIVLEELFGVTRLEISLNHTVTFTDEHQAVLKGMLNRLKEGEPVQYVFGKVIFNDIPLKVNANVLIPRPETEEWIWQIVKSFPAEAPLKILDIGTGSGCIAIFLARLFPKAEIYALDISQEALLVAQENANLNGVKITFILQDILATEPEYFADFDVIVSNPPYIPMVEKNTLHVNVINFEPHTALFAEDPKGVIFYEKIASLSALKKGGRLYLEVHAPHADEVKRLLEEHQYQNVSVFYDLNDRPRMVWGILA